MGQTFLSAPRSVNGLSPLNESRPTGPVPHARRRSKMHPYRFVVLAVLLSGAGSLFAQEKLSEVKLTEVEKKFEAQVIAADKFLSEHTPYAVAIESTWKGSGHGQDREGKNVFRLVVGKDRKQFRIEAGTDKDKHPALVVGSDGKSVSGLYAPGKIYSHHACEDHVAEHGRD